MARLHHLYMKKWLLLDRQESFSHLVLLLHVFATDEPLTLYDLVGPSLQSIGCRC